MAAGFRFKPFWALGAFLVLAFSAVAMGLGNTAAKDDNRAFFAGAIDGKYAVHMKLVFTPAGKCSGEYFYDNRRQPITLTGSMVTGRLRLQETSNGKTTGNWDGKVSPELYEGTWTGSKPKPLTFRLKACSEATYTTAFNTRDLNSIQDAKLKSLAKKYQVVALPFTPDLSVEAAQLELEEYALVFDTTEMEPNFMNNFHAGQVFFQPDYFGLVTLHEFSPGAFGIFNNFTLFSSYRYDGTLIAQTDLGCQSCSDTNMGSNDYYSTTDSCIISAQGITCHSTEIHATLMEDQTDSVFHDEQHSVKEYPLLPDGSLKE